MLGIPDEQTAFDVDILVNINSVIFTLLQLGIDPETYPMVNESTTWSEFDYRFEDMDAVKMYIYLKTKMAFDPPTIGSLVDSYKNQIAELEWRLNINYEERE